MAPERRRTKGDGSLYKRSDGMWIGRVELPPAGGKRRWKTVSSKDRNKCLEKLKQLRAEVESGRIAATGSTTVAAWMDRWLEEIQKPRLRPRSYRDYRITIDKHITPHVGDKKLLKLTPDHVRQMHQAIESDRQAQKAHVILQAALSAAVKEGVLPRNVAQIADRPRYAPGRRRPLTADEAKLLIKWCADHPEDPMSTRWAAAILLGARQGELLGLRWSHVDLENGFVDLEWQLQQLRQDHGCGERHSDGTWPCGRTRPGWCPHRKWDFPRGFEHHVLHRSLVLTRPKTSAGTRVVPIPAPLLALMQQTRRIPSPHGLVWCDHAGRPINPRDDHRRWKELLAELGLPEAPLHVARHTTATLLMQAGVSEQVRMKILGHVSVAAQRAYAHVDRTLAREAMESLNELLA